jgi:hypothetical protein
VAAIGTELLQPLRELHASIVLSLSRARKQARSRREATRLLKRYLARHLYRLLQHQEPLMA